MRAKNKAINQQALTAHTRLIFSISQQFPAAALALLKHKMISGLTQKQMKQLYEIVRERNIFPVLTHPKTIMDFCAELSIVTYSVGHLIQQSLDCLVILEGAVKIYQQIWLQNQRQQQEQGVNRDFMEDLRLSMNPNLQQVQTRQQYKIQKAKLVPGDVIIFNASIRDSRLTHIVSSSSITLLRIPYQAYSSIAMASFMVEIKKKQQFFSKIPLFQKHYRSSLEDFVNCLEEVNCGFGKKVFGEGETVSKVYIVKEGEFILQKSVCTDDVTIKQGKVIATKYGHLRNSSESLAQQQIKNVPKHFRACPYKIIGPKQILGDCEYLYNDRKYAYSMRCHKQDSKIYAIDVELYFKKVMVSQNPSDRAHKLLEDAFKQRKQQIEAGVKFNTTNMLIVRMMQTSAYRTKTEHTHVGLKQKSVKHDEIVTLSTKSQRSHSFFEKMNKSIINQNKGQIRKRNESRNTHQSGNTEKLRKIFKTPAVVQQVVHIVNQKKAYHRLRNSGMQNRNAFEFDINNVPPYIKKKYGMLDAKKVSIRGPSQEKNDGINNSSSHKKGSNLENKKIRTLPS